MIKLFKHLRVNLVSKLILSVGLTLLLSISTWAYFNINYQTKKVMKDIMEGTDRLSNTIISRSICRIRMVRLGTDAAL